MSFRLCTLYLCFLFTATGILLGSQVWPDSFVRMIVCDVGQGDAILITSGFKQILIDTGQDDRVLGCLNRHLPFWDRSLEIVILSHPHSDHIGGLPAVTSRYRVGALLLNGEQNQNDEFTALTELLPQLMYQGTTLLIPAQGSQFYLDSSTLFTILWPKKSNNSESRAQMLSKETATEEQLSAFFKPIDEEKTNYNNGSIALLLEIGEISLLTTGDLEAEVEEQLVSSGLTTDVDVLKAGHHGSKTSSTSVFLKEITPELTLISCGLNNSYNHPHPDALSRLELSHSQILRTDLLGDIELVSNGSNYWVE